MATNYWEFCCIQPTDLKLSLRTMQDDTIFKDLVESLNAALGPYGSDRDNERLQNLEELVKRGARFGYLLFTQPTDWTFHWGESQTKQSGTIVVYPALMQIGDDQGRRHANAVRFTDAQTVHVGSTLT